MARPKQANPRQLSSEDIALHKLETQELRTPTKSQPSSPISPSNGVSDKSKPLVQRPRRRSIVSQEISSHPTVVELVICVAGIYTSFLTWALLQERITTTPYGPNKARFKFHLVLLTVQSLCASAIGYLYILYTSRQHPTLPIPPIFPTRKIAAYYLLIAVSSSLAAPFGYAALSHIDYITFILAKSCKLLPVMFLHLTLYQRRYPLYKYIVVLLVTSGVAVFTLYNNPAGAAKKHKGSDTSSLYGLLLLSINLLLDGVTNSTQDHMFATSGGLVTGPQMQCGLNLVSSLLTAGWLAVNPWSSELTDAIGFMRENPNVVGDVMGFALCGAVGQVFIFYTLSRFGSLTLVTVTVTRKMFSMILSVFAFGHTLSLMQWLGVGLVFGGIGGEAEMKRREKKAKIDKNKKAE
ncbi:UDP-galactose transporter [Orbilia blumenaviensis]|uniref:UDP-galactose transporter homolog 1 n=1 Tax=Orbilia blumenaviensis TaxID=1796055 RepID=A0AAV9U2I4_9PEZI